MFKLFEQNECKKAWACLGVEPRTSCTRNKNHTTRLTGRSDSLIFSTLFFCAVESDATGGSKWAESDARGLVVVKFVWKQVLSVSGKKKVFCIWCFILLNQEASVDESNSTFRKIRTISSGACRIGGHCSKLCCFGRIYCELLWNAERLFYPGFE